MTEEGVMERRTPAEIEHARRLAEACLRDRLNGFAVTGTTGKGWKLRVNLTRIAPKTANEDAWEAYCNARTT